MADRVISAVLVSGFRGTFLFFASRTHAYPFGHHGCVRCWDVCAPAYRKHIFNGRYTYHTAPAGGACRRIPLNTGHRVLPLRHHLVFPLAVLSEWHPGRPLFISAVS